MGTRLRSELNFEKLIESKRLRHEVKIINKALLHYGLSNEVQFKDLEYKSEKVKNYSVRLFTVRYKGKLLIRRKPADLNGLMFRYESPIFNNVSDPI